MQDLIEMCTCVALYNIVRIAFRLHIHSKNYYYNIKTNALTCNREFERFPLIRLIQDIDLVCPDLSHR